MFFLKRMLLAFWALWSTVVFTTNALDAAKALGVIDDSWAFASGNYRFIEKTTSRYGTPDWLNAFLFAGVIVWEGTTALLFWLACWRFGTPVGRKLLYLAFTSGLGLWGAFLIADEIFVAYSLTGVHLRLLIAEPVDEAVMQAAIACAGIERDIGNVERAHHVSGNVAAP